jgi:hypothetical protein
MPDRLKTWPKAPTAKVLRQVADLGRVPAAGRKLFFDAIRTNVQTAWELDGIAKGALANSKGATLHHAALTLYDKLGNLEPNERVLIEGILSNLKFNFDRISSEGVGGLWQITYQLARLFGLVTGKLTPRHFQESPQSRKGGTGTVKHPIFQQFVCDLLISATAADGNLTLDVNGRSGTLIDAIKMLADYLPDGFGPSSLSLTTLKRLKAQCKAGPVDHT